MAVLFKIQILTAKSHYSDVYATPARIIEYIHEDSDIT